MLAARGIASVAIDLPGFGASPLPSQAGGARWYAELVAPLLREVSDQPVIVVGHSFGGRVATVLAASHPELVRGVLLTGVPLVRRGDSRRSPWRYRALRALADRGVVREEWLERARQHYGSADYRATTGILRAVLVATVNESYEPELAVMQMPVALVWGEQDRDVPLEVATRAAALLPQPPTMTTIAACGHLVPTTAPKELLASLLNLVAR